MPYGAILVTVMIVLLNFSITKMLPTSGSLDEKHHNDALARHDES
jgi:hypothetical protein